jgi:hypothetical protein
VGWEGSKRESSQEKGGGGQPGDVQDEGLFASLLRKCSQKKNRLKRYVLHSTPATCFKDSFPTPPTPTPIVCVDCLFEDSAQHRRGRDPAARLP